MTEPAVSEQLPASNTASTPVIEPKLRTEETSHLPVLDGIRGLAILLVLIHHQFKYMPKDKYNILLWWERQTSTMWVGVDLFFVLSGFLITRVLLAARDKPHYFRNFYAKRALRIFPLYFFWVAVATVVGILMHGAAGGIAQIKWWTYIGNFVLGTTQTWTNQPLEPGVDHFWSLCVEEHFYLIWPLVILLLPARRLWWVIYSLLAFPLIRMFIIDKWTVMGAYVLTPARIDSLMIGGCLSLAVSYYGLEAVYAVAKKLTPLAVVGWVYIYRNLDMVIPWTAHYGFTLIALLFGHMLIMTIGSKGWLKWFFERRWLKWLGKYSYGLYVIHAALLPWVVYYSLRETMENWIPNPFLMIGAFTVTCACIYLALAYVSYNWYEKWFLQMKKRFQA